MTAEESRVCFVTTCMGRLASLAQSLPTLTRQPGSGVIVVDYSCPDRAGDWVETHHPECQVVRIPNQQFFHLGRAKNAGFRAVSPAYEWVCFVDADVCLSPSFSEHIGPLLEPGGFLVLPAHRQNKGLTGLLLVSARDFSSCGGFDESYENYGRESSAMRVRLLGTGLRPIFLADGLARHLDHDDELRSRHYREKNLVRSSTVNSRKLRALIEKTEVETGRVIPPGLCQREGERAIWRRVLLQLRGIRESSTRHWLSRSRA